MTTTSVPATTVGNSPLEGATRKPATVVEVLCDEAWCVDYARTHEMFNGEPPMHQTATIRGPIQSWNGDPSFELWADHTEGQPWQPFLRVDEGAFDDEMTTALITALTYTRELCLALNTGEASA
ncbi:hypothetical protein [Frondihabitans sp. VKM Ac-2883]|uniref:hypothetical protein n=1 Tax=Frondihabitans sp. VKM Ac-2883 TaxID=2783823 RepID=UPI00188CFDBD|nr:hypothetical protein [Frondihabitans sp. VKM Ac-2883]MBF4575055.1 hypothetical protein [Frondihabitans sp. VKM Ac-2883]